MKVYKLLVAQYWIMLRKWNVPLRRRKTEALFWLTPSPPLQVSIFPEQVLLYSPQASLELKARTRECRTISARLQRSVRL